MEVIILDLFLVDTDGGEDVGAVGSDEGLVLGAQGAQMDIPQRFSAY
jgi:hypothetical protein